MIGVCSHNCLEEYVLPLEDVELFLIRETFGNPFLSVTRYTFIFKDAEVLPKSARAIGHEFLYREGVFANGGKVLINGESDAPFRAIDDFVVLCPTSMGGQHNTNECNESFHNVNFLM